MGKMRAVQVPEPNKPFELVEKEIPSLLRELTRTSIADLFQMTPKNVTMHVRDIYNSSEAKAESTSKNFLLIQKQG